MHQGIQQFGLIAEDVAKVHPNLVIRDRDGAIKTVRYESVNAMLLNEFLKEHRKVTERDRKLRQQEETIAQLRQDFRIAVAELNAQLKEQETKIQKVSAQLEASGLAPRVALNIE